MTGGVDISVVLATRNRARILEATLASFARQRLGALRWEAIVVDNGSTDDTAAVIERARDSVPLVALAEPMPGKNRALNRGLAVARGELFVFTDDDVLVDPAWLAELHGAARRWPDAAIFGGVVNPLFPPDTPEWLRIHDFARTAFARFSHPLPEGILPEHLVPYGPNFAVRASAMAGAGFAEQLGPRGEDYPMGGETELIRRLRCAGNEIVYVPSAVVGHVVQGQQLTLGWLYGRSYRQGRGEARIGAKNLWPKIAGVPRYLWREAAMAWLARIASLVGGRQARFEAGRQYHRLRGQIFEHRLIAREQDNMG